MGYGAVGVTWARGQRADDESLTFEVRTRTEATGRLDALPYDDEHGPDPSSEEARHARPGTDVLLVGKVDEVQVRSVSTEGAPPADMTMSVIAPGQAQTTDAEPAAIETTGPDGVSTATAASRSRRPDGLDLQATTFTPKPVIYSREQWGANERMRDQGSLHYFEVHAGFVHHTVNANGYSRAEVPGILRSIYAYHTQSLGWSDVGYNFLVDKFGRIWEGRAGGVDRPVVGAHTLGYNDYVVRDVGDRQLRDSEPERRDAAGLRQALRLEAVAARRRRLLGPGSGSAPATSRRSTATATPARPPAPAVTSTPGFP